MHAARTRRNAHAIALARPLLPRSPLASGLLLGGIVCRYLGYHHLSAYGVGAATGWTFGVIGTILGYYFLMSREGRFEGTLAFPLDTNLHAVIRFEALEPPSDAFLVRGTITGSNWNRGQLLRLSVTGVTLYADDQHVTFVVPGTGFRKDGTLGKRQLPVSLSASPDEFNGFVQSEARRWRTVIRENGVKLD